MSDDAIETPAFTGGCQCGAVRYTVAGGPVRMILCHCDMCCHATGAPLPGFISVPAERISWTGSPATYRSSSMAERGFCAACGTPLFYRSDGSATVGLAAGAARVAFTPTTAYYTEERPAWLNCLDGLSDMVFPGTEGMTRFTDS